MTITLSPETHQLLQDCMRRDGYANAEETLKAALASLEQQKRLGDFAPGELDRLLSPAQSEIDQDDLLDGETVFEEIRQLGKKPGPG